MVVVVNDRLDAIVCDTLFCFVAFVLCSGFVSHHFDDGAVMRTGILVLFLRNCGAPSHHRPRRLHRAISFLFFHEEFRMSIRMTNTRYHRL